MHKRQVTPCFIIGLLLAGCAAQADYAFVVNPPPGSLPPPRIGDTAVYRVRNAYNGESRGEVQYRVDKIDGDRPVVAVTATSPYPEMPRAVIYAPGGNWLRHPMVNHNQSVDYDFVPPFPAYAFPLDVGKEWSTRVNAKNLLTGRTNSVRVDGVVLGIERMTTAAGAFDVVKIRRRVYAGDWDGFLLETNIVEVDWYAPALGRSVRLETNSSWLDTSRSGGGHGIFGGGNYLVVRGDWSVSELVSLAPTVDGAGGAPPVVPGMPAASR